MSKSFHGSEHAHHSHRHAYKTEKNILIAFLLNASFSIFEFISGIITGSIAITSDAVHDLGDALSIGIAYGPERKNAEMAPFNSNDGDPGGTRLSSPILKIIRR